jgi:hypothetical protein
LHGINHESLYVCLTIHGRCGTPSIGFLCCRAIFDCARAPTKGLRCDRSIAFPHPTLIDSTSVSSSACVHAPDGGAHVRVACLCRVPGMRSSREWNSAATKQRSRGQPHEESSRWGGSTQWCPGATADASSQAHSRRRPIENHSRVRREADQRAHSVERRHLRAGRNAATTSSQVDSDEEPRIASHRIGVAQVGSCTPHPGRVEFARIACVQAGVRSSVRRILGNRLDSSHRVRSTRSRIDIEARN